MQANLGKLADEAHADLQLVGAAELPISHLRG
jgi:hypothetical protein